MGHPLWGTDDRRLGLGAPSEMGTGEGHNKDGGTHSPLQGALLALPAGPSPSLTTARAAS